VIFLDTNVVSETMSKKPNAKVMAWLQSEEHALCLPAVVVAEIAYGIERIRPAERSKQLETVFENMRLRFGRRVYVFDEMSALVYGKIVGGMERLGRQISVADGMIAATAMRHNAVLATGNTKHFAGLGLELVNPWN
jgi:predicted nucleic acid-binding protein